VRAKHQVALAALAALLAARIVPAQQSASRPPAKGWEFVGLPALNFATDEGLGYGVLLEAYNYGTGVQPYKYTIQPTVFLTTKGRRDFVVFFDAPMLLPRPWRIDAIVAREEHLATPYYGLGNTTPYDTLNEVEPNAYYYRYGKRQFRFATNLQRNLGSKPARLLVGAGFIDVRTDPTPFDSGSTLFLAHYGVPAPRGRLNFVRAGAIWDSRNREIGPSTGTWADVLVQRVDKALGSTYSYTRATVTARKYWALTERLVYAQRLMGQQVDGLVPIFDLATVQTSFKQQEGLGGSNTVRGLPKNRFMGKGLVVSNSELRWRATEFSVRRKPMYLVLSGFVDAGRVWESDMNIGQAFEDLHVGFGGGLRVGIGPSFVAAFDLGRSSESTQIYIGLGYPF
jgi:outer membrane protein assembly factor BamA